jgi:predicted RNA-binding protein with EMAP domain
VEHEIDQKISKIKYQYASQNETIDNFNNLILVLNTTDDILKPIKREIEYSEKSFKRIFDEVKDLYKNNPNFTEKNLLDEQQGRPKFPTQENSTGTDAASTNGKLKSEKH